MKAVSLHQPHAALMWRGLKTAETRSRPTPHRGELAIASTQDGRTARDVFSRALRARFRDEPLTSDTCYLIVSALLGDDDWTWERWHAATPLGVIGSVCDLVDCVPIVAMADARLGVIWPCDDERTGYTLWHATANVEPGEPRNLSDQRPFGDFSPGRFAWLTESNKPIEPPVTPAPCFRRGLWEWAA